MLEIVAAAAGAGAPAPAPAAAPAAVAAAAVVVVVVLVKSYMMSLIDLSMFTYGRCITHTSSKPR